MKSYLTSKQWWRAAGIRALRTVAQTALATIGIAYYDGRAVAVQIQTNGTITVRNLISSAGSGQTSQTSWCYMTA